ncbi:VTT domain-containing protein [Streptomyces sp. RPA4-5]|uniref:DedA family protein n=1 Tax=Streptomyces sp. RPA4-5 TaxID=2721245 RepID=UPI002001DD70|nr:VTT domain-containing protein [Streptomyces sp. RPA4-5]
MFEQLDQLTASLQGMLGSPWLWLVILLVSGLDALLPFMPSETTVVLVAVLIGPDPALLALLAGVAAAGALAGDCLGYAVGRYAGSRASARLLRGERGRARHLRARARVERHAALLLIAGRFLPGGRVVAALSTGEPPLSAAPLRGAGRGGRGSVGGVQRGARRAGRCGAHRLPGQGRAAGLRDRAGGGGLRGLLAPVGRPVGPGNAPAVRPPWGSGTRPGGGADPRPAGPAAATGGRLTRPQTLGTYL